MKFSDWLAAVPQEIRGDALWTMEAYRLGLFAGDLGWRDVTKLAQDNRTSALASQLYRALGSVHANLAEGYSRSSGKDRARFYEYSLGSARESRSWYFDARHVLDPEVTTHRIQLQTQIIRLLLKMIPDQREQTLCEDAAPYHDSASIAQLLAHAPIP
jgi:four helix bundle protein